MASEGLRAERSLLDGDIGRVASSAPRLVGKTMKPSGRDFRFVARVLPDSAAKRKVPPFFARHVPTSHNVVTIHLIDGRARPRWWRARSRSSAGGLARRQRERRALETYRFHPQTFATPFNQ